MHPVIDQLTFKENVIKTVLNIAQYASTSVFFYIPDDNEKLSIIEPPNANVGLIKKPYDDSLRENYSRFAEWIKSNITDNEDEDLINLLEATTQFVDASVDGRENPTRSVYLHLAECVKYKASDFQNMNELTNFGNDEFKQFATKFLKNKDFLRLLKLIIEMGYMMSLEDFSTLERIENFTNFIDRIRDENKSFKDAELEFKHFFYTFRSLGPIQSESNMTDWALNLVVSNPEEIKPEQLNNLRDGIVAELIKTVNYTAVELLDSNNEKMKGAARKWGGPELDAHIVVKLLKYHAAVAKVKSNNFTKISASSTKITANALKSAISTENEDIVKYSKLIFPTDEDPTKSINKINQYLSTLTQQYTNFKNLDELDEMCTAVLGKNPGAERAVIDAVINQMGNKNIPKENYAAISTTFKRNSK